MTPLSTASADIANDRPAIFFIAPCYAFERQRTMLRGYDTIALSASQQVLDRLIDRRAAFVFVDARLEEWQSLILGCKNNPATRRVPLCLVSDDRRARMDAVACGAEFALRWAELDARITELVAEFARVPDPATLAQLDCECRGELPALAEQGLQAFNRGEFYQQHDLFEAQWVETVGPVRDLYRAILQVGVAYYQIERGNYRGALKMLQRSVQWLHLLPDVCQGIDVAQLRRDSYRVRAELQRLGPGRLAELDRGLLKGLRRRPPQDSST
ncbi:MAG: DUF309 domain-containing protein [Chloroflexi bacterium]|nr:DUF309 domain-containing protein [Chloroflexota bacterium]